MSNLQRYLTIGSNPNVAFYAWRLSHTKQIELTVVDSQIDQNKPISFKSSSSIGSTSFSPAYAYTSVKQIPASTGKAYDVVIISCSSLQEFQTTCFEIAKFVNSKTLLIVESTGYINLEPFISMSFPKSSSMCVMSIMNESDVRKISTNQYYHQIKNNDTRIYFGTSSSPSSKTTSNGNFQKFYKLLQTVQEQSSGSISLLKSVDNKEFMTYQWKLALPRIIFNPLMILFEIEFPELLKDQILSKPLITGLLNELFKLVKKMDCKLVKGFENEANLIKSWSRSFPETKTNDHFMKSPVLFYNYYKKFDLELDLLLLQPILLSDDSGLKTPYLENLYSVMCQFNKINTGEALFFKRKLADDTDADSSPSSQRANALDADIQLKTKKQFELNRALNDLETSKISMENELLKEETNLSATREKIAEAEARLSRLQSDYQSRSKSLEVEHEAKLRSLHEEYNQKMRNLDMNFQRQKLANNPPASARQLNSTQPDQAATANGIKESTSTQDGLSDLKHIVQYGADMDENKAVTPNGTPGLDTYQDAGEFAPRNVQDSRPRQDGGVQNFDGAQQYPQQRAPAPPQNYYGYQQSGPLPPQQYPQQHPQQQYHQQRQFSGSNGPAYNGPPPQGGYFDQLPPHGLPSGGMAPNQFPPNLKSQGSSSNMQKFNHYQAQMSGNYNQQQMPQSRRLSSMPGGLNGYQDFQPQPQSQPQQQQQQQPQVYPPQHYGNHASFNNAAPIDPFFESRFKNNKKNNRRSNMPQLSGNLDGLDMGGRGGMPQPGTRKSFNSPPQARRSSSNMMLLQSQANASSMTPQPDHLQQQQQHQQQPSVQSTTNHASYMNPPNMNSSSSSTNTNDTPVTSNDSNEHNVHLQIPSQQQSAPPQTQRYDDSNAKPLGGIAESNLTGAVAKKKKKGLFGRSK
ncbi:uncharacterized protein LODBEIA_P07430 [Lodderomyces beijingensis]|uniref:Ketopantoate reductase C-terminal domain-containing protein n=1 Tax=Lodderomyces beijingensis TaxID=1775926 RepID=A0ABP0ZED9_9ASCO